MGLFGIQVAGRASGGLGLRLAQHPVRGAALQHHPHDPHQRADRLAAAGLLRRHLLPCPRGIRARDLVGQAGLPAVLDHPRRRHPRRGRQLPRRHPRRPRVSRATALGQVRHPRRGGDLPVEHLDDRAGGPQDRDHGRSPADGPLALSIFSGSSPSYNPDNLASTRCTGGSSSTFGSKARGNW
jgi:hypothetical protein